MTFDLAEARRLHDRGEHDPGQCDTCSDSTGRHRVPWPCDTAKALGATGRTEWTTPPFMGALGSTKTIRFLSVPAPETCGATRTYPDANTISDMSRYPCILRPGHPDDHRDECQDAWEPDQKRTYCSDTLPEHPENPCTKSIGHTGDHEGNNLGPWGRSDQCCEAQCMLNRGHLGVHITDNPDLTPCDYVSENRYYRCIMGKPHVGPHRNINGVERRDD